MHIQSKAYALFRQPYQEKATYIEQTRTDPEYFPSVAHLNGKEGFVFAPFLPSAKQPVVLIHPEVTRTVDVLEQEECDRWISKCPAKASKQEAEKITSLNENEKERYADVFDQFHHQLVEGKFQKLVLSRTSRLCHRLGECPYSPQFMPAFGGWSELLFMKACRMYPRMFVALVDDGKAGTWLMATPELLLKGEEGNFATMSLAGTQKATTAHVLRDEQIAGVEWSEKNREEQQIVTNYIEECIRKYADECSLTGPYTTVAGNLYHLRTDIRFRLHDTARLGDFLKSLYPTPAVCGIPKKEAYDFICKNENSRREYYSGFAGMLSPQGSTQLFVSLRCANLSSTSATLYAGGGLLAESEKESEWAETEAKLQTIAAVFGTTES